MSRCEGYRRIYDDTTCDRFLQHTTLSQHYPDMLVTIAAKIQSYLPTLDILWPVILILLIALTYALTVYPLVHGHLRHIPGPWYAKMSSSVIFLRYNVPSQRGHPRVAQGVWSRRSYRTQ
jgi:hypothetical protein